ncbi:hypothetical protein CUMW_074010, partial [Citrus unshiu]
LHTTSLAVVEARHTAVAAHVTHVTIVQTSPDWIIHACNLLFVSVNFLLFLLITWVFPFWLIIWYCG